MVQPSDPAKRQCPTRVDGGDVLICHLIGAATCQGRQRAHYHKCHLCIHQNDAGIPRIDALPPRERAAPAPGPVALRVDRAG